MKTKLISRISLLVNALVFTGVGITIIFIPDNSLKLFHLVISTLIIALGLVSFLFNIIKTKKKANLFSSMSTLLIGIIFYFNPNMILLMFPVIFGLYMLINGLIKLISYFFYKKTGKKGCFHLLLSCLIDLGFSYVMILNPSDNIRTFSLILGIYLVLFGFNYLYDLFKDIYTKTFLHIEKKLRVSLPFFISVFLPYREYRKNSASLKEYETPVTVSKKEQNENIDLEVFIQVKNSKIGIFGHADIYFENKVYSYGAYDEDTRTLFNTLGPGVLYEVDDREAYLKFCTYHAKRIVFSFGLSLTDKQKEKLRKKLKEIKEHSYRWKCNQEVKKNLNCTDHASRLYKDTKAKFYKFKDGNYKNYFLLSDNCMKLVDDILGENGISFLKINGLLTPGAYYYYLNKDFKRKNSSVITKSIYNRIK